MLESTATAWEGEKYEIINTCQQKFKCETMGCIMYMLWSISTNSFPTFIIDSNNFSSWSMMMGLDFFLKNMVSKNKLFIYIFLDMTSGGKIKLL